MRKSLLLVVALIAASLVSISPHHALAATAADGQPEAMSGISMTPAIQDRVLSPKNTSTSFSVELFNRTDQAVTLTLSTTDFKALNQTGGVAFLGGSASDVNDGHGLSRFLKLDATSVTIEPNKSKVVQAKITDVSKLALGGHYGAILARTIPQGSALTSGNRVNLNQVLSSLIFLETAGEGTKNISMLNPTVNRLMFSLPDSLNLAFKATGNTQTIPRGVVDILHGQKSMMHGIINENSSLVLPDSTRLLETKIVGNQHPWWPGKYTLRIQYRYDGALGITTYEKTFLYVNSTALLLMVAGLIITQFGLVKGRSYWAKKEPPKQEIRVIRRVITVRDESHNGAKVDVSKQSKS